MLHDVSGFACSPPPYRPHFGSLIDLPGPKLRTTAPDPAPRAPKPQDGHEDDAGQSKEVVQQDGDGEHIVEEKITPSQASDTNKAFVIGLHACYSALLLTCIRF